MQRRELIALGLALLAVAFFLPEIRAHYMAVVYLDPHPPAILDCFVGRAPHDRVSLSTDPAAPTPIDAYLGTDAYIWAKGLEHVTRIRSGSVEVRDPAGTVIHRGTLSFITVQRLALDGIHPEEWWIGWRIPHLAEGVYVFSVRLVDRAGNADTELFYAKVNPPEPPDGDFYINDQLATPQSVLYFGTLRLTYRFVATRHPEHIVRVWVEASKEGVGDVHGRLYLTRQPDGVTWLGSYDYTRPGPGRYEILGYFEAADPRVGTLRKMSIVTELPLAPEEVEFVGVRLGQMALGLLGAGVLLYGWTRRGSP